LDSIMVLRVCFVLLSLVVGLAFGIPAGFTTFFDAKSCPPGWSELSSAKGRLLVSVTDSTQAGITVNPPLVDQEDRKHTHKYLTSVQVPSKAVAAIDCCNNQAACNGIYGLPGESNEGTSGLPFIQLPLCTHKDEDDSPVPFGAVAYFEPNTKSCPTNWIPYAQSEGRVIIAGFDKGTIASETKPLDSGEDRRHSHSFSTTVRLNDVSFEGVAGCCNDSPAEANLYTIAGNFDEASSGLPYIQLLTCMNMDTTFDSDLPPATLLFNEIGCVAGWNISLLASGRFVVANPNGGVAGAEFGASSLKPGQTSNPAHPHQFAGTLQTHSCGVGLASGCCASGYAADGSYPYSGTSADAAINLPYLSVPLCLKFA